MNSDLAQAKSLLKDGEYTCVLCKHEEIHTSMKRGVLPLVEWLDSDIDFHEFSVADKVVGKAAAFLYSILGVKEVYAPVMSEAAIHTLAKYGINPTCDVPVKSIINRTGTGICPMEQAVKDIQEPEQAFMAIKKILIEREEIL